MKSLLDKINDINSVNINHLETNFLNDFNKALLTKESEQKHPKGLFRPSSIHGCARMLYLQEKNYERDERNLSDDWIYKLISICECGTDRHTRIQEVVQIMDKLNLIKIIDIESQVKEANKKGLDTEFIKWNKDKTEARCKSEQYRMYFQPDGLVEYQGIKAILEIKTANGFKFNKLKKNNRPATEHVEQATCYATLLGIEYILFIYEDNNFKEKFIHLHKVDNYDKDKMKIKVDKMINYIDNDEIPPKESDKCLYCKYKNACIEIGD